jgi:hypothetical protein
MHLMRHQTRFGSLQDYEKGGIQTIDDDPRNYAFSNIFEVAARSQPWEKVALSPEISNTFSRQFAPKIRHPGMLPRTTRLQP